MTPGKILQILTDYCENSGHYFYLYSEYAEPGYDNPESGMIATGNWNSCRRMERVWPVDTPNWLEFSSQEAKDKLRVIEDNTMPRIAGILEKLGVELEWEDEWCSCSECGRLVRTSPDSYSWTRSYWAGDGELLCQDCVLDDPEGYLEELEGNHRKANTLDLDLEFAGYRRMEQDFENGLYGGQCDSPETIADSLRKLGVERFIFQIDSTGQFDTDFSVWVHKSEWSKVEGEIFQTTGPDPALTMQAALADASRKLRQLDGPGVKVAHCHADGTATVKLVSPEDFIAGKALD